MPPRGRRPGFKIGRTLRDGTRLRYWIAKQIVTDIKGFPDKCIPLPSEADEGTIDRLCHEHTSRLLTWIDQYDAAAPPNLDFDGTVLSLSRLYQQHDYSPFKECKINTRRTYAGYLKLLEQTVGARVVRKITMLDVRHWHREWRAPSTEGGRERVDRAHDAVRVFKNILGFGHALGFDECGRLKERLANLRFARGAAREQEMTYALAAAFVRKAIEMGANGIIPVERARAMAIGVAAQFELALRQKDVIGEWMDDDPARTDVLHYGAEMWVGRFRWDNLPGWRLRLKTSKTRAAAIFTLTNYPLLFQLLDAVPLDVRQAGGPVVTCERGLPIRERSYRRWFREIARAAEIPDDVWAMDARAGAATEADSAGADLKSISDMLTHAEPRTTLRYIRRREKRIADAAKVRVQSRSEGEKT